MRLDALLPAFQVSSDLLQEKIRVTGAKTKKNILRKQLKTLECAFFMLVFAQFERTINYGVSEKMKKHLN